MVRSAAKKVMWVGRATVFMVGLAVIVGLVVGLASTALAANGANFIIGNGVTDTVKNIATLPTRLTMQGTNTGPALQVTQQSTNTGAQGLGVTVPAGKAPITVNSTAGKATNLNADKLDGKDSTALGVTMKTAHQLTGLASGGGCTNPGIYSPCAPVTVKVPTGKQYHVTVSSSFAAKTFGDGGQVIYCPAIQGGSFGLSCIGTGSGATASGDAINLASGYAESAAISGEIGPLPAGSYTFSTTIQSGPVLFEGEAFKAHTTVMVRDVSAPGPPIN